MRRHLEIPLHIVIVDHLTAHLEAGPVGGRRGIEAHSSCARRHAGCLNLLLYLEFESLDPLCGEIWNHLLRLFHENGLQVKLELDQVLLEFGVKDFLIAHILHSDGHEPNLGIFLAIIIFVFLVGPHAMLVALGGLIVVVFGPLELGL